MRRISIQPFISLRDATFRLGDRLVFANTNWRFSRDEQWAVLGPNGSGKSLFADALRGTLPLVHGDLKYHFRPQAGFVAEQAIGHMAFEDRRTDIHGTVAQSRWNSIEEEGALRVREFLSYERVMEINPFEVAKGHASTERKFARKLAKAIRLLRIETFMDRTLLSLSNGERQKVQIVRALCHSLRLLILDDPYVGLDNSTRQHLHALLEQLMTTSLRLLLITPRIDDLPRAITHVVCVRDCQIAATGTRAQILGLNSKANTGSWPSLGRTSSTSPTSKSSRHGTRICSDDPLPTAKRLAEDQGLAELVLPRPVVDLKQITVRYGKAIILHDINWTIYPGESWALLGPNGSGKTTLLSLIQGDHPQAYMNHVEVFGHRRGTGESIWELKRQIGWISPELHLHFNQFITSFEVVASGFHETIGLFEAPTGSQRKATRYWLDRFQMLEFAQTPLFALSLGQQRIVLLARALVKKPKLLILDEPCQGLDADHRKLFLDTLDELLRSRTLTAIYVTHRPDEIPSSIKRVFRLPQPRANCSFSS